ncbi:hypothetical protein QBC44DRAFT_363721 [Cladorrhinum sp. PSN332]|nr:hypothetical protein QBC44DRAFT_363721 [Cladorrhinum sp. PSN332]
MHPPLKFLLALLPFVSIPGALSQLGNGPTYNDPSIPDGADKLEECGCWPIYQAMLRCQKISGNSTATRECVCIPNPDGWYSSFNGCRGCVAYRSYSDNNFFDNYARTIQQLFVSCTEKGGGVASDGASICASNSARRACTGLREGGRGDKTPSWASYEVFGTDNKGNGTQWLNIAEYKEEENQQDEPATVTSTLAGLPSLTETPAPFGSTQAPTETSTAAEGRGAPAPISRVGRGLGVAVAINGVMIALL